MKQVLCKMLGHKWLFPKHMMVLGSRGITIGDYICSRCGKARTLDDSKDILGL